MDQVIRSGTLRVRKTIHAEDVIAYVLPDGVRPADYSPASPEYVAPVARPDGMTEYRLARPPSMRSAGAGRYDASVRPNGSIQTQACPKLSFDVTDSEAPDRLKNLLTAFSAELTICVAFGLWVDVAEGRRGFKSARADFFIEPTFKGGLELASATFEHEWELPFDFVLGAIPTPIGPVVPNVGFKLVFEVQAGGGGIEVSFEHSRQGYLKLDYLADRTPKTFFDFGMRTLGGGPPGESSLDNDRTTSVDLHLKGDLSALLWDRFGPFVAAGPYLDFWQEMCGSGKFNRGTGIGLRGDMGLRLDWFLGSLDFGLAIPATKYWPLLQDYACGIPANAAPPPPVNVGFTDLCTKAAKWSAKEPYPKCPDHFEDEGYVETRKVNVDGDLSYDTGDQIVLTWQAPRREVESFVRYQYREPAGSWADWSDGESQGFKTYRLDEAKAGTYRFQVQNRWHKGTFPDSNDLTSDWTPDEPLEVVVEPPFETAILPDEPTITDAGAGSGWAYLAWAKPHHPGSRRPDPRLTYEVALGREPVDLESPTTQWAYVRNLSPATAYCLYVQACDENGKCSFGRRDANAPGRRCLRTLPRGQAEWRLRARCEGRAGYVLDSRFDLSPDQVSAEGINQKGTDYSGAEFRYNYRVERAGETETDGAAVTGYFEIVGDRGRMDAFEATLSTDTGDIRATPVIDNFGCAAVVRFDRPAAAGGSAGSATKVLRSTGGHGSRGLFLP